MQPDKIAMSMSAFEKAFENIEVSVGVMGGAMETSTATMVPTEEVDALMLNIATVCCRNAALCRTLQFFFCSVALCRTLQFL